ncbi:4'-phosphopantetheinyl transferase family protein [Xylanimonas allomyrinae]|uniref:4'-phosphopantetheinyl transferase family protein n=1 Tax=Xylanimonas allomyrinae TaxID=2509459 RepID=UPI0013A6524E|nr:4'-phosphopantetheinyl transferase superfamily protein [Xylanimonas allomyrinae]
MNGPVLRVATAHGDGGAASRDALRSRLLADVLRQVGVDAPVTLVRRCRVCGSHAHGKPEVAAALAVGVHVSLAHTSARTAVVAATGPVGVDIEDVDAVAAHPVAGVLLSPAEHEAGHPLDAESLTRTWVRKEALLKATGYGLHVPPSAVTLSLPGAGEPRLLGWAGPGAAPVPVAWDEGRCTRAGLPTALTAVVVLAGAP